MAIYWTLARAGEHPAKARQDHSAGGNALDDDVCQGFPIAADLADSSFMRSVVVEEEDLTPSYEVVRFHGDPATECEPDGGLDGLFVLCEAIADRTPVLDWLRALAESGGAAEAAANQMLTEYRAVREMFDEA